MLSNETTTVSPAHTGSQETKYEAQDIHLAEYNVRQAEIKSRLESHDRHLNYLLLIATASLAVIIPQKDTLGGLVWPLCLSISFLLSCLTMSLIYNEVMIAVNAAYVHNVLRPRFPLSDGSYALAWEEYHSKQFQHPLRLLFWGVGPLVYIAPISVTPLLFWMIRSDSAEWYEWTLFRVDLFCLFCLCGAAVVRHSSYARVTAIPGSTLDTTKGIEAIVVSPLEPNLQTDHTVSLDHPLGIDSKSATGNRQEIDKKRNQQQTSRRRRNRR